MSPGRRRISHAKWTRVRTESEAPDCSAATARHQPQLGTSHTSRHSKGLERRSSMDLTGPDHCDHTPPATLGRTETRECRNVGIPQLRAGGGLVACVTRTGETVFLWKTGCEMQPWPERMTLAHTPHLSWPC
jgi:hypothetical protein